SEMARETVMMRLLDMISSFVSRARSGEHVLEGCFRRRIGRRLSEGERFVDLGLRLCQRLVRLGFRHRAAGDHGFAKAPDRILRLEFCDFVLRSVNFGIALEVAVIAIGLDLDQGRPLAAAGASNSLAGYPEELKRIVLGHMESWDVIGSRPDRI